MEKDANFPSRRIWSNGPHFLRLMHKVVGRGDLEIMQMLCEAGLKYPLKAYLHKDHIKRALRYGGEKTGAPVMDLNILS